MLFSRGRTAVLLSAVELQYLRELLGALLAANQDLTAAPWPPNTVLCVMNFTHKGVEVPALLFPTATKI